MRYSSILSVVDIPRSQPGAIRHGVNSGGGDSFLSDRLWPTATTHGGIHLCQMTWTESSVSDSGTPWGSSMKTVAEYREFAAKCREMAARMTDPQDRRALELQASAWEKVADAREAVLQRNEPPELG